MSIGAWLNEEVSVSIGFRGMRSRYMMKRYRAILIDPTVLMVTGLIIALLPTFFS